MNVPTSTAYSRPAVRSGSMRTAEIKSRIEAMSTQFRSPRRRRNEDLNNARAVCEQCQTILKNALSEHGIEVPDNLDGLNVWVPLDRDPEPVLDRLAGRGSFVGDGSQFSATPDRLHNAIRVFFRKPFMRSS